MNKLTDLRVSVITESERINITTPVSVTKDGHFTTTLPKEAADTILQYGLTLRPNRAGTPGFFESETLAGLSKAIEDFIREAVSRELVDDRLVIKYRVHTRCNYAVDDDGEIIPDGRWRKNPKPGDIYGTKWRQGTCNSGGMHETMPMIGIYAGVFHKRTYTYRSGKTVETLETYRPKDGRGGAVDWINSLCNISPSESRWKMNVNGLPEVEATDENAALFVRLFQFIFQTNEMIKDFDNPDFLQAFVAANRTKEIGNL